MTNNPWPRAREVQAMDKKHKQHRQKGPSEDELRDIDAPDTASNTTPAPAPPGASFDTEQGRAAQGMRKDIGKGGGETVENAAAPAPAPEVEGAMGGASDGSS